MSGRARLPVLGVMGSGREPHAERAIPLGRRGLVLGVLPGDPASGHAPAAYPNPWVEIVIRTHLPHSGVLGTDSLSRNHINVLSADAIVALPGGAGTASEVVAFVRGAP